MVELVRAERCPDQLSRECEPSAQAIRNWVAQADQVEGLRSYGLTSHEREELRTASRETYGAPRVHAELAAEGRP